MTAEPAMPVALRNFIDLHSLDCVWYGVFNLWRVSGRGPQVNDSNEWRPYCYIEPDLSLEAQIEAIEVNVVRCL